LWSSTVLGALFFLIGHGTLHWAEKIVPSGMGALLVASEPLLVAVLGIFIAHETRFTWLNLSGLIIGFAGVALLATDKDSMGGSMIGALVILAGTAAWSLGMLYSGNAKLPRDPIARAGLPVFIGSLMLLAAAAVAGEFRGLTSAAFTFKATAGLLYLIVFGSIVAFTAYTWLLGRTSPVFLATHTYVNPIVAVFLGWLLADEVINGRVLAAGAMVVVSVVCVSIPLKSSESDKDAVGEAA
jgi:drug/metabolite transporter (DMT)-like permease